MPDTRIQSLFYIHTLRQIKSELEEKKKHVSVYSEDHIKEIATLITQFTETWLTLNTLEYFSQTPQIQCDVEKLTAEFVQFVSTSIKDMLYAFKQSVDTSISILLETGTQYETIQAIIYIKHIRILDAYLLESEKQLISSLGQTLSPHIASNTFNEICTLAASYAQKVIAQQINDLNRLNNNLSTSIYEFEDILENINNIQKLFEMWQSLVAEYKLKDISTNHTEMLKNYNHAVLDLQSLDWSKPLARCLEENTTELNDLIASFSTSNLSVAKEKCDNFLERINLVRDILNQTADNTPPQQISKETLQKIENIIKSLAKYFEITLEKYQVAKKKDSLQHTLLLRNNDMQVPMMYLQELQKSKHLLAGNSLTPRP